MIGCVASVVPGGNSPKYGLQSRQAKPSNNFMRRFPRSSATSDPTGPPASLHSLPPERGSLAREPIPLKVESRQWGTVAFTEIHLRETVS